MKKIISILLASFIALTSLAGCNTTDKSENKETKDINMVIPDGLTAMAAAKLVKEDSTILDTYNMSYSIEKTSENIVSKVLKGDVDIAVVPSNVAAKEYNKNSNYVIAGTLAWGSFYLVSTEDEKTLEDLKGKEIYNIGKGLTPDIIMRSILKDKGFDPDKDFNFSYVDGVTDLVPVLLSGKTKYAVIPEPALTTVKEKIPDLKILMSLNDEWKTLNNSEYGYPQASLIIKKDLIDKDKDFTLELLNKVKESCSFANDNPRDMADICEEIGVSAKKEIIPKAIEKANINFTYIKDCDKEYDIYFNKLKDFDSSTIGGKVPDEGVYMEK